MKDVKPSQLLVGRDRDLENNPDFSNKDLSSQQTLAVPGPARVSAAAPLQSLQLAPEQSTSVPSLPHTPKAYQVIVITRFSKIDPVSDLIGFYSVFPNQAGVNLIVSCLPFSSTLIQLKGHHKLSSHCHRVLLTDSCLGCGVRRLMKKRQLLLVQLRCCRALKGSHKILRRSHLSLVARLVSFFSSEMRNRKAQ